MKKLVFLLLFAFSFIVQSQNYLVSYMRVSSSYITARTVDINTDGIFVRADGMTRGTFVKWKNVREIYYNGDNKQLIRKIRKCSPVKLKTFNTIILESTSTPLKRIKHSVYKQDMCLNLTKVTNTRQNAIIVIRTYKRHPVGNYKITYLQ